MSCLTVKIEYSFYCVCVCVCVCARACVCKTNVDPMAVRCKSRMILDRSNTGIVGWNHAPGMDT
jgi:hypothetical protein